MSNSFATPWTVQPARLLCPARILYWVVISFSRGYSQPRDGTRVFYIGGQSHLGSPGHKVKNPETMGQEGYNTSSQKLSGMALKERTSVLVQWMTGHLPTQRTQVQPLGQEVFTC